MADNFDVLIDSFIENEIGIDTDFLSESLCAGLQQNIQQLQKENRMIAAGIGNSTHKDHAQKERSDKICWMDKSHNNNFETEFLLKMESFITYLNSTCYTGINSYEFHYALYEEGSYYKRHKDQFDNNNGRKYSIISYLNTNWDEKDGGHLLVYQNDAVKKVLPQSQTTVFFKSHDMEHEVTKAHRSRMSVTGWLKQE